MKKVIFYILFLMSAMTVSAQNVVIDGSTNKANALVRLFVYDDMLSCEMTEVCSTRSDNKGNFRLETDLPDITLARIAVNLESVDMLLNTRSSYKVKIEIPENNEDVSYFERQESVITMLDADDDGLYYQFTMTENIINEFILNNFNQLYRGRRVALLDSLDSDIERKLGTVNFDFVKDYIRYKKGVVMLALTGDGGKKVMNEYFLDNDILYSQPAYMDLFKETFTDYFLQRKFEPSEFMYAFASGYDNFVSYLKKDDFLANNDSLFELIFIWNLRRMYYENPNEKKIVNSYLDIMKSKTMVSRHKTIINDIQAGLNRLAYDTDAPSFSLRDAVGDVFKLSDHKDKMILLQFVSRVSQMSEYQFERLSELESRWQDTVEVVTIATNNSFEDYKTLFKEKGYNWTLLNLEDDILLWEKYQIKTCPEYVIIKTQNKIGMAPAPSPEQYLEYHIRRIYGYH